MNKSQHLAIGEVLDSYRVFPRLFLLACFWWTVLVTNQLLSWYIAMPKEDRGIEASGFASIVFVAVLGFLKMVYSEYSSAGRSWGPPTSSTTSSTVVATTTETK